jgi:hypothetical protein
MKKIFLALMASIAGLSTVSSQKVMMTFNAGVAPQHTPSTHHIFVNRSTPRDEFTFDLAQVKASYLIGAGARYDMKPFFLAAEAQYNRREYVYNVDYTFPGFGRSEQAQIMAENMNVINLPLSLGVDLGIVDVTSGFLPQWIISQQSDLADLYGYSQKLDKLRLGWHSGIAANINDLRVGILWQMDFNNYADHAFINGQNLELPGRASRMLGTLSYQF